MDGAGGAESAAAAVRVSETCVRVRDERVRYRFVITTYTFFISNKMKERG